MSIKKAHEVHGLYTRASKGQKRKKEKRERERESENKAEPPLVKILTNQPSVPSLKPTLAHSKDEL